MQRRLLSLFLCLLMLLTLVPASALAASFEEEPVSEDIAPEEDFDPSRQIGDEGEDPEGYRTEAPELELDVWTDAVLDADGRAWFRFVPQETAYYDFFTTSSQGTIGINDVTGRNLGSSNSVGDGYSAFAKLEEGQVYYLFVRCWDSSTESVPVLLRLLEAGGDVDDGLSWTLDKNGLLSITGSGDLTVSRSGAPWYPYYPCIEALSLGEGLTSLCSAAFMYARFRTVLLPDSLASVAPDSFLYCSAFESFEVKSSNPNYTALDGLLLSKYGKRLLSFPTAKALDGSYKLPESIEILGAGAFASSIRLGELTVPASVQTVEDWAFSSAGSIGSLCFLGGVPSFGQFAMNGLSTTILYPMDDPAWIELAENNENTSITYVGYSADGSTLASGVCGNELSWTLSSEGVLRIEGEGEMSDYDSWRSRAPWYGLRAQILSVEIGEGVTAVGQNAFYQLDKMVGVRLPESLREIRDNAFSDCYALTELSLPESLITIGSGAFARCRALTELYLPDSLQAIGERAFYYCEKLSTLRLPESKVNYGEYIFNRCRALTEVKLPERMTDIPSGLFYGCSKLEIVHFPTGLKSVGEMSFAENESLETLDLPEGLEKIGESAFGRCGLKELTLPPTLTELGPEAFAYCSDLYGVTLPEGLSELSESCFRFCSSLKSLHLPSSITNIGDSAFEECTALEAIDLPEGLMTIGSRAFSGCSALKALHLPSSLERLGEPSFTGCKSLALTVAEENPAFCTVDGVLMSKDQTKLLWLPLSFQGEYEIPGTVTEIASYAIYNVPGLTDLTIPASVETIDNWAATLNPNLSILSFRGDAPELGWSPFARVKATAYYPEDNETWTEEVQANCDGELTWVPYAPDRPIIASDTCGEQLKWTLDYKGTLTVVGSGPMDDYSAENPAPWAEYRDKIIRAVLTEGVTRLGSAALSDCTVLKTLELPAALESIGDGALQNCIRLQSVALPGSLRELGARPFLGCEALKRIDLVGASESFCSEDGVLFSLDMSRLAAYPPAREGSYRLPDTVTEIGDAAFAAVAGIGSLILPGDLPEIADEAFLGTTARVFYPASNVTYVPERLLDYGGRLSYKTLLAAGSCGISMGWLLDTEGSLLLYGSGYTYSYYPNLSLPWAPLAQEIKSVSFESGVVGVSSNLLAGTAVTEVTVPATIRDLGSSPFEGAQQLQRIDAEPGGYYNSIDGVLYSADGLELEKYPEGKTDRSFSIPNITVYVRKTAFLNNPCITRIDIPASVEYLTSGKGEPRFAVGCTALKEISVAENNKNYSSIDGVLFYQQESSILRYPPAKAGTSYVIPEGVEAIQPYCFDSCASLTAVGSPESLHDIYTRAFNRCTGFESFTVGKGVYLIAPEAFAGCTKLTAFAVEEGSTVFQALDGVLLGIGGDRLVLYPTGREGAYRVPETVAAVEAYAFWGCTGLTELELPEAVSFLYAYALGGCTGLQKLFFEGEPPRMMDNFLTGVKATAYVPKESEDWTEELMKGYGGEITWKTYTPGEPLTESGDANGDGRINGKDAILLAQFLAGWDVELEDDSMDLNGDGKVNGKDAILLAQYLAGWDVEFK